jgi:hypothetical protein
VNDPTLIEDLLSAGLAPALVARVIDALHYADCPQMSLDCPRTVRGLSLDKRREKDRLRKRVEREKSRKSKAVAKANDVAASPIPSADASVDMSADSADKRCNLLTSLSSSSFESRNRESKKEPLSRARGSRLVQGQPIADADRDFALDYGMAPGVIATVWVEFVDYWIGIPGQRGTKLDWPATWRNRVRAVGTKGKRNGEPSAIMAALDRRIAETAGPDVQDDFELRDITPRGLQGR